MKSSLDPNYQMNADEVRIVAKHLKIRELYPSFEAPLQTPSWLSRLPRSTRKRKVPGSSPGQYFFSSVDQPWIFVKMLNNP